MDIEKVNKYAKGQKSQEIIFMTTMLIWPIAIFLIFYVYVNINMIVLAFQTYDIEAEIYRFAGFTNFADFFSSVFTEAEMGGYIKNSFIAYGFTLLMMPISILVSNHIYKKFPGATAFRIILFLPSIIPGMVWTLMFRYFVEGVLPSSPNGTLLTNPNYTFWTMIFYSSWLGFAGNMVLYTGAMSRIPPDLVEYGELDGLKGIREFYHLTLPLIYPTITVFLVTGVAGIFTNQIGLFSFFGGGAPTEAGTIGYYFFYKLFGSEASSKSFYTFASASGIAFTFIVAPITILAKYLLEKYGPTAEY